jgi:adenylate kinase family enzyme
MTAPVLAYYRSQGLLATVDGTKSIDDVQADIRAIVDARMTALSQ